MLKSLVRISSRLYRAFDLWWTLAGLAVSYGSTYWDDVAAWLIGRGVSGWLAANVLVIPGWAMAVVVACVFAVIFLSRRVLVLESARDPKFKFGGNGREPIEMRRYDEHRRDYLLNVENPSASPLRECRFMLESLVGSDGKEKLMGPLDLHQPRNLSPGERLRVRIGTAGNDAGDEHLLVQHHIKAGTHWVSLNQKMPADDYVGKIRVLSDDSEPMDISLDIRCKSGTISPAVGPRG